MRRLIPLLVLFFALIVTPISGGQLTLLGAGKAPAIGSSCTTVYDKTGTMTSTDNFQTTLDYRIRIPTASLGAATGTKFKLTLVFQTGVNVGSIDLTYFGIYAPSGGFINYDGNQTQATWNSGSASLAALASSTKTTDLMTFAAGASYDQTKDYIIGFNMTVTTTISAAQGTVSGTTFYAPTATASATTSSDSGSTPNYGYLFTKIEICT